MTRIHHVFTIAAAATLVAGTAAAQDTGRLSIELRAGAGVPTSEIGTRDLETGLAVEMLLNVQVMPHLNLYAGWDWAKFAMKPNVGLFDEVEQNGYAFGARFFAPSLGAVTPWIRAGGIYDHIELEADDEDDIVTGDHFLGWEAGLGAAVALGSRWALLPGIRYRAFSPELDELGGEVDLNSLRIDIGLSRTFGGPSIAAARHR